MKKLVAIITAMASAALGFASPGANAATEWSYGTSLKKLNAKLSSLGMSAYSQSSSLGKLPKTYFGSWPASYSDSITYSEVSDGYTPTIGEGAFIFVKGNESSSQSTTIVNFELPQGQTIASDGGEYYFELFPYDKDEDGSEDDWCTAPTKASVSGKTLSITINCAYGQGFGGYFLTSSLITQPGLYENAVVYKTVTTKRSPGNMYKIRMPETNLVDYFD
jgi:hypothetical protein